MSKAFEAREKVTSSLFDGEGEVVGTRYEQGVTIVSVRVPEDSGLATRAGVAAIDSRDLRHA